MQAQTNTVGALRAVQARERKTLRNLKRSQGRKAQEFPQGHKRSSRKNTHMTEF